MNEILQRYYEDDFCIEAEELLSMVQSRRTPQEYRTDNNIILNIYNYEEKVKLNSFCIIQYFFIEY